MRHLKYPLILILGLLTQTARADIVIIVNPDSPLAELNQQNVSDLYLGRTRAIHGAERFLILDQPRDSDLRSRFFAQLNGMSLRSVNAYWARLQFSGDSQPPIPLSDSKSVVETVRHNRLAIGYIDAAAVTNDVRPILTLRK